MEPHQECAYDHIEVYDGITTESNTLGRYCGSKLPHPIVATDNQMLLVFKSDASVQRRGFLAKHMTGKLATLISRKNQPIQSRNLLHFFPVCGGHLKATGAVQKIFSHSLYGDANYQNKEDCDWIIEAPAGKNVHLSFLSFEMEDEQDCGYDYIEVFSGYDDAGPSYGRFCGNKVIVPRNFCRQKQF